MKINKNIKKMMVSRFQSMLLFLSILVLILPSCDTTSTFTTAINSPNQTLSVDVYITDLGEIGYKSNYENKVVVDSSALGFVLDQGGDFSKGMKIIATDTSSFDDTWEQPWGEEHFIRNNYRELIIKVENKQKSRLNIIFRAFDDGLAIRYEFPEQANLKEFKVLEELTQYAMPDNHEAWWIPAFAGNRYEYIYNNSKLDGFDRVHTPFTMETSDGLSIHLHEAALYDYPSMVIKNEGNNILGCELVPLSSTDSTKANLSTPFQTPWRTVQIGKTPGDLITNYMLLNLNEPNKLGDVSWVEPGKYIGVWWEMFVNLGTWHQGPKHAANTKNVIKYIDFASEHGFAGVLVEGWNYGWDGNWMSGGTRFDFTKPYPDYDIDKLSAYAKEKNVYIIGHHETGADTENYDAQLDDAYKYLYDHGMKAVKSGYVELGDTLPNGYYHHGQYFVQHFQRVIEAAAKHKTMVVAHEPIKDTGKRRTYPNMVSREGARGQEFNAMGGNPASHVTVLPFTRCLAGPFDYTPGVFDIKMKYKPGEQVSGTLTRELALYIIIYAPMQMANDLPENYEGHPAFQFIKEVATDWETTKVLNGEIGEFVTIARKARATENWFIGSISNEKERDFTLALDFLNENATYTATIYTDGTDGHYDTNPTVFNIQKMEVNRTTQLKLKLAAGGGTAISITLNN
jgi:alpha-glucosidase